jgi:hypothetical protein
LKGPRRVGGAAEGAFRRTLTPRCFLPGFEPEGLRTNPDFCPLHARWILPVSSLELGPVQVARRGTAAAAALICSVTMSVVPTSLTATSTAGGSAEACYVCTYRGATSLPVHMLRPSTIEEARLEAEKTCKAVAKSTRDQRSCVYVGCTTGRCPRLGGPGIPRSVWQIERSPICIRYGFDC